MRSGSKWMSIPFPKSTWTPTFTSKLGSLWMGMPPRFSCDATSRIAFFPRSSAPGCRKGPPPCTRDGVQDSFPELDMPTAARGSVRRNVTLLKGAPGSRGWRRPSRISNFGTSAAWNFFATNATSIGSPTEADTTTLSVFTSVIDARVGCAGPGPIAELEEFGAMGGACAVAFILRSAPQLRQNAASSVTSLPHLGQKPKTRAEFEVQT